MTRSHRLAAAGRIDRNQPLTFTFNGRDYPAFRGDTLASGLLANGVHLVARSLKYHRPRGIVAAGVEESNALVQVGEGARSLPNMVATQVELYDGLTARSVNVFPSVEFDLRAVHGWFARFMPPGFYYKTFMWPAGSWRQYEHQIRKAAGFGVVPADADPDDYDHMNAHCDVLVVGAGPAGLAAALEAGRTGARVILMDERTEPGGTLLGSGDRIEQAPAWQWAGLRVEELASLPEVQVLIRTTAAGYYEHNFLLALERRTDHLSPGQDCGPRQRLWRIRARQVVLATGAIERPLVFCNNDRPGVMLASGVSEYIHRYGVLPGSRAVVFTNNDSAYRTAFDLLDAGATVEAVVDARSAGRRSSAARERGLEVIHGHAVVDVRGTKRIRGVRVMALSEDGGSVSGRGRRLECDLLAVSGGWNPNVQLHAQSGARPVYDARTACFVPGPPVQAERPAGACRGSFELGACVTEGFRAGAEAAHAAGHGGGVVSRPIPRVEAKEGDPIRPLWIVPAVKPVPRAPKQFVDPLMDVSSADILTAAREGYDSIEYVKRYTNLGMGPDQGRLGNVNGIAILAGHHGTDPGSIGTTTFRPMYTPVTFAALSGGEQRDLFDPVRKTAIHEWHVGHGALFETVGQWKRPWYFPKPGESLHEAVDRECLAVRRSAGVLDASTLGKIDIQGPDANVFLNRVYTNPFLKVPVGRCRYGLMLDENGMLLDDGVTARLGENHYLMHTTTGGAAHVMSWLELWLQTEWPELRVYMTSVTDHWATVSVCGPDSRRIIRELCSDVDLSRESFPFMAVRGGTVAGVPARIFRISFTGELTYEVNVNANLGRHVWEAVMDAGEEYGITPFGTEAMHVLRAEKGYIIAGQDTDGSVTPVDLGMERMLGKNKDFLGKRSLFRSYLVRKDRKQFVGLLTEDPKDVLPEGGQIVDDPAAPLPLPMLGHVTSSYYSAALERSIALGLVKGGHGRMGETVHVRNFDGRTIAARIADPVFYDPEGERQNV